MKQPNKQGSKKKNILISCTRDDAIVDTINNNGTQFVIYNRFNKDINLDSKINLDNKDYFPIPLDSNYLTNNVLLLPSQLNEYGDIKDLLKEIKTYIYKYVDVSDTFLSISVYYVLLTYLFDNFSEIPYLRVIGDYGSGKSRLLNVIGRICYNPVFTNGGTSTSALFRMTDMVKGTLILDEADFQYSETTNEIIKILNCGYAKGNPILRADGENFEPRSYDVFGPKIIGGRYEFRDKATESRCINEIMKRTNRKDLALNLDDNYYKESNELRNKLYKFRYDYFDKITPKEERIDGIEPRLNQILNPIFSLINNFGEDQDKSKLISYFQKKQEDIKQDRRLSLEGTIFGIIKETPKSFTEISYSDIANSLEKFDGWYHKISPRKLGSILRQFEITPERKNSGYYINVLKNSDKLGQIYISFGLVE